MTSHLTSHNQIEGGVRGEGKGEGLTRTLTRRFYLPRRSSFTNSLFFIYVNNVECDRINIVDFLYV